jgi:peptidoglycan/LPS O-acetylase OafA/YrhL
VTDPSESTTASTVATSEPAEPSRPADRAGTARRGRFPHFPALDGLRGLAVAAAVLYDLGWHVAKGGSLGLSTLFTLTGFLAMASLLAERGDGQPISLGRFWTRRVRHVLGASLVVIGLAVVFAFTAAAAIQRHNLAADGIAALASVANWRFIANHAPFGPPTTLSSPVRQFWALAVIGQVVLVVSLATVFVVERLGWSRQRLGALFAGLAVISTGLCIVWHHHAARVLYGSDTRAAEVLVGCLLALIIYDPRVTIRLAMPGPVRDTINSVGVVAGLVLVVIWMTVPATNRYLLEGGLLLVALVSATVVLAAIIPHGPVAWFLGTPPLRWLGRFALAWYLVHWPVFVWVDRAHTGWTGATLVAARLVISAAGAVALELAFEQVRAHERSRTEPGRARFERGVAGLSVAAVVIALLAATLSGPAVGSTLVEATGRPTTTTTLVPLPVPTVAFYGDALASTLEASATSWAARTGKIKVVDGVSSPTCGIDRDELVQDATGAAVPIPAECSTWATQWASSVATTKPDIAVVVTGISEVAPHREPTDAAFTGPGDAGYNYQLLLLMHQAVASLTASGTKVIWLNLPNFQAGSGAASNPATVAAFNKLLDQLSQGLPGQVTVADLNTWLAANGGPGAEPSQNGWGASAADHVMIDYVAAQIAARWRAAHTPGTTTTTAASASSTTSISLPPPPLGVDDATKPATTPKTTTSAKPAKVPSGSTRKKTGGRPTTTT